MTPRDLSHRRQTGGPLERVKREYAVRRRRQAVSAVPLGALAVATAASGGGLFGLPEPAALTVVGIVVLGFFGFSLANWRCPACDAYLGRRLNPATCPSCGGALRDG
jgi:hypothetical protein